MDINNIPIDCMKHVIKYMLDYGNISKTYDNCTLVCKRWRGLFSQRWILGENVRIYQRFFDGVLVEAYSSYFNQNFCQLDLIVPDQYEFCVEIEHSGNYCTFSRFMNYIDDEKVTVRIPLLYDRIRMKRIANTAMYSYVNFMRSPELWSTCLFVRILVMAYILHECDRIGTQYGE